MAIAVVTSPGAVALVASSWHGGSHRQQTAGTPPTRGMPDLQYLARRRRHLRARTNVDCPTDRAYITLDCAAGISIGAVQR